MKIGYTVNLGKGSGSDITKEEVERMIAASEEKMDQRIVDYNQAAIDMGAQDDIRTYDSKESFPDTGTPGVQYIAADTQTEWQWFNILDPETGIVVGGEYREINQVTSEEDIEKIFDK